MRLSFILVLAMLVAGLASAADAAFLSKQEVTALATGKAWDHVRTAGGHRIHWELREGGDLYANNFTSGSTDRGTWSVNDAGQLCVKWRGRSNDRCLHVRKVGDKLQMVDSNDLASTYAELTIN